VISILGVLYSSIIESGKNWIRFGSGSNCSCFDRFGLGHYEAGLSWVGSFWVWVISVHAKFRGVFGNGSGYFKCLDQNQFIPFQMSVRVWVWVVQFRFWVVG